MIVAFEHRTHLPTQIGNHVVCVDDDGAIYAHQNARDPAPGAAWTAEPARVGALAQPRDVVERVLRKHGFFELDPLHESPATQGGVIRTLTYWDREGAPTTVTVDRAKLPAFDRLVQKLFEALELSELPAT